MTGKLYTAEIIRDYIACTWGDGRNLAPLPRCTDTFGTFLRSNTVMGSNCSGRLNMSAQDLSTNYKGRHFISLYGARATLGGLCNGR